MRAVWSGALSFGLIYIPVKLYDATRSHSIDLTMLRKGDHCQIHYAYVCRETGEEVAHKDIVKGFEFRKGEYVEVDDDDFKRAAVEKTGRIDIVAFVDENSIDHKYLEKPFFLEPDKKAKKAYILLREALLKSGKVGVARYVMKTREHMCIIKAEESTLILNQIRYADELRSPSELDLPKKGSEELAIKELEMAVKLIDQLSEEWKPEQYKDTYFDSLNKVIEQKVEGKPAEPLKAEPTPAAVTDLFSRLNESLELLKKK